jgi:hypothetical protein
MEGFDEALDRTIWSLFDQRLKSAQDIAHKRRDKPSEIEALLQSQFSDQEKLDLKELARINENFEPEDVDMEGEPYYSIRTSKYDTENIKSRSITTSCLGRGL